MHPNHSLHLVQLRRDDLQAAAARERRASRAAHDAVSLRRSVGWVVSRLRPARALRPAVSGSRTAVPAPSAPGAC